MVRSKRGSEDEYLECKEKCTLIRNLYSLEAAAAGSAPAGDNAWWGARPWW